MFFELMCALIGRLVVFGFGVYVLGTAIVWAYIAVSLVIAGGPIRASIGG